MRKYIGKPTHEIRVNLNDFEGDRCLGDIISELERQDSKFNTVKSYAVEVK
jgi:hypothetical protein